MYKTKKWNEILSIISGKNQKDVENPNGKYPIYGSGGIMGYADEYLCEANTVIIGRKGTINKPIFVDKPFWNIDTAFGLAAGSELDPKFLYYFCVMFNFYSLDKSTGRPSLAKSDLLKIEMPCPNMIEQKRVVSKIDEMFSELDNGIDSLKQVDDRIELYKYAAIDNAIKYENLSKIKDNILDMGQGWSPKCEKRNSTDDNEWAVIKTTAVQAGEFVYQENKVLPSSLEPKKQHEIEEGDILITRAGPKSRCGVCCLVKKTKKRLINCDKVYRIKVDENKILPQFLEYVLNSPRFLKEIALCKTGGNDSGLNLTQDRFLDIEIPVPSIEIQKQIIAEIEARISICDGIRSTVSEASMQSESLRLSILKEAFEGRL